MTVLSAADINEILGLLENSQFAEMRLEMGDFKIELRRAGSDNKLVFAHETVVNTPKQAVELKNVAVQSSHEGITIPSPMLGIFYHAPKPGDEPFVKVGDTVTPDTVIGIIEVMKLMTRVNAGVSGVITQIIAPSGELVEHGDALIRVKVA